MRSESLQKRLILGLAIVLAAALTILPAHAAVYLEKSVRVDVGADGAVETHRMRVELESSSDAAAWTLYPIFLDANRELRSVEASAVHADGKRDKVKRKERDRMEVSGTFHDSAYYEVLSFDGLQEGSILDIEYQVAVAPYFPAGQLSLSSGDPVLDLDVVVEGPGLRWRIDGRADGFETNKTEHGVRIRARDLSEIDPPDYAPSGAPVSTYLRYAWSDDATWEGVGAWYQDLLSTLPRADESVRAQARELIAGVDDRRERLELLLGFLREQIRYVAVEVGIGGYVPTASQETLDRRWGDCKAKAMLLIDMLKEAEITAYPVLIYSGNRVRIDREFPSPFQFNHLIVAVPEDQTPVFADDPVSDGFLFLDPTQELGGARWLHPGVQDQDALVVAGDDVRLARTPLRPLQEVRYLRVDLTIDEEGAGRGTASLTLRGGPATSFLADLTGTPPERIEEVVRYIFKNFLPGGDLEELTWREIEGDVPAIELASKVRAEDLVQGLRTSGSPSLRFESMNAYPSSRYFDEREMPIVLSPDVTASTWTIRLPQGLCLPSVKEVVAENEVGLFRQSLKHGEEPGVFILERTARLDHRWIEGEALGDLRALAIEESRALKRRVRLRCEK